jgi:acetolactate synthase I/II/III large subunit
MYFRTIQNATVAQLLLDYLQLEGVNKIFGVPGGAVKNVLNTIANQDAMEFVVCRHESSAAYLAEGYTRLSGKPGVVMATSGPGATNALTGVMNAHVNRSSVVYISGEVPEQLWGKGFLQEGIDADVDVNAIYAAATAFSTIVTHENNFQELFTMALRAAMSQPRQTVHISLPDDIASNKPWVAGAAGAPPAYQVNFPVSPSVYRTTPQSRDPQGAQAAFDALLQASRPVIFLGNGCRDALADPARLKTFTAFVEKLQIPVMTTPDAKGIFPESHPVSLRSYGMAASSWSVSWADGPSHDAVLVIASAMKELATSTVTLGQSKTNEVVFWDALLIPANGGPLIQVDLDQHAIGRAFPISRGVVAEAGLFLDDLCALAANLQPDPTLAAKIADRFETLSELKINQPAIDNVAHYNSDATPIFPEAAMRVINEEAPKGANLFVDAGNCVGWCLNYLAVDPPSTIHSSLDMGPMGWACAAVVGAKFAAPDAPCIAITGDGAFMMLGAEVSTAAAHNLGPIWIVLNDNDLHMVSQGMAFLFSEPGLFTNKYRLGAPDLGKLAEALGAESYDVSSTADFRQALRTALAHSELNKRPQVISLRINPDPLPPYYTRQYQPIAL